MSESGWLPYLISAIAVIAVAGIGAWATDISTWYFNLKKPSWQPPDWLFGPAWTSIFALVAFSAGYAWNHSADVNADTDVRFWIVLLFAINGVVNILWSVLFFSLKRPRWAMIEVIFLWLSIVVLIVFLWPVSMLAALLLVPYLAWVTFAAILNRTIIQLNPEVK